MKAKLDLTHVLTGLILSLLLLSIVVTGFGVFMADLQEEQGVDGTSPFANYSYSEEIDVELEKIKKEAVNGTTDEGLLDIIGSFFRQGYAAVKITSKSGEMFDDITQQAVEDAPILGIFKTSLYAIILVIIVVGVLVTALLKWKV